MILPHEFLEKISYYTVDTKKNMVGFSTVFKLYRKEWWRIFPTKIKCRWGAKEQFCDSTLYEEPNTAVALRNQLNEYFRRRNA